MSDVIGAAPVMCVVRRSVEHPAMTKAEREQFKDGLRDIAASRGEGLDLDTPFHWVSEQVEQPIAFFEHLPALLPADAVLYFEGTSILPELASFYDRYHSPIIVPVARDTIWPVPDIYHVAFSGEVCARLREFSATHAVAEMFDHIKA